MFASTLEPMGTKLRRRRRRLGLTLDDLAGKTGISKPYLSLIETGRVNNPPSDEKLSKLEKMLEFTKGELVGQAHLQRTPRDVQAMLHQLMQDRPRPEGKVPAAAVATGMVPPANNLDTAYLSGLLQEMADRSAGNVETISTNPVPVINRVSAGYPTDFTDLSYPRGVADDYVSCPDVHDRDAFAARVYGDSMQPKYRQGDIVIFSPGQPPRNGDDCFVRFENGHTTFKRVFFESGEADESVIRLQPRNEKYRPQMVKAAEISGLYRALYRYQKVDE